jgi:hypothetical protein
VRALEPVVCLALALAGGADAFDATDRQVIGALCGAPILACQPQDGGRVPTCGDSTGPSGHTLPGCLAPSICELGAIVVHNVYRGSFSSRAAVEALVDYESPCASHLSNFGGYALLRKEGTRWTPVLTDVGRQVPDCVVYQATPPAGDFLACPTESTQLGDVSWDVGIIRVRRHARDDGAEASESARRIIPFVVPQPGRDHDPGLRLERENLMGLCDNSGRLCAPDGPTRCVPGAPVSWFTPHRPDLRSVDVNGDGRRDLRVRVTLGHFTESAEVPSETDTSPTTAPKPEPRPRGTIGPVTIDFVNTGTGLRLSPLVAADQAKIMQFNSCTVTAEGKYQPRSRW